MPRRKKNEIDTESTQTELTIENQAEMESEEAELLAGSEETPEENSEGKVDVEASESEEKPEKKPRRQRRPRAKKVEAPIETAAPETEVEVAAMEIPAPVELPKIEIPKFEANQTPKNEMEAVSLAAQHSLDAILKQWAALREISAAVSSNLEKISQGTKPAPSLDVDTQEFFRPQNQKPLFITKFATAASLVAMVLSLVSLSLAQSARQAAIAEVLPANRTGFTANAHISTETSLPNSKTIAPEVAITPKASSDRWIPKGFKRTPNKTK